MDNDWDIPIRVLSDDEFKSFPVTDEPDEEDDDLTSQLEVEKSGGHPANDASVPDYEPVDTSPDED